MSPASRQAPEARRHAPIWSGLALAAGYFAAGKLALLLAIPPGYATAVWPAAGIALVGLLLCGRRVWPGVWLGSFLTNIDTSFDPNQVAQSLSVAGAIGAGAAAQALLGATLIRRSVGFPTPLAAERDILRFLHLGGPVACVISATCGVLTLTLAGFSPVDAAPFSWFTWWVGDTIGVLITAPLVMMLWAEPREVWGPRRLSVGLPLVLTFVLTVGVFVFASRWEEDRARGDFERQAENLSHRVEENVARYVEVLRSVSSFFAGSEHVDRQEFHVFVGTLMSHHPGIRAVSWNPRVRDEEREDFERSIREEGFADFQIVDQNEDRKTHPAAQRSEYVPVAYVEPFASNRNVFGYDTAYDHERRSVQEAARDSGVHKVTGRLQLVQSDENSAGVLVFAPVYRNGMPRDTLEARRENLLGFVAGVLEIEEVMATALRDADLEGVDLRLMDDAAAGEAALLWGDPENRALASSGYRFRHALDVPGLPWTLHAVRDGGYLVAHRSLNAWVVMLGGLMLGSLLGCFLLIMTGRTFRIEALIMERTLQLSRAKEAAEQDLRDNVGTELALRVSERQFRSVTESANDAIVLTDENGLIIRWNPAAQRCFGYEEEEALGQSVALLMPERYREAYLEGLARLSSDGTPKLIGRLIEFHGLRKDGSEFPVEISLSTWRAAEGIFYSGVLRDVTERHLSAEELELAFEKAEAANLAKGEFLANMSHEIRTPMNAVIAMSGLLENTELDAKQRDFVETIRTSGDYLLTVINDILDFSKIEAGRLDLEVSCFDLRRCVGEAIELMDPQISAKGLSVRQAITRSTPMQIFSDAGRLRQVIVNLLGNAVKFTEAGEITVEAEATRVPASEPAPGEELPRPRWELHFRVCDTGIGIPSDRIDHLFDAFTQADSSVTRRFGGTGLGLAISKQLCELLGGRIWAESEAGGGSTFHFTIVAEAPSADDVREREAQRLSAQSSASQIPDEEFHGLRILLAEDSPVNQKVARLLLGNLGIHQIDAVANGLEALEALERQEYDLVLMDVQMPEMDGLTATREICSRWPREERPPVIAMTAHARAEDHARCLEAGMDGYVPKPILPPVLDAELRRVWAEFREKS